MTALFTDPRLFSYVIMTLYALSIGRWVLAGSWADAAYWFFALGITATVTWGYTR